MPELDIREFADVDNVEILNTIRDNSSPEYFNRVPEATQANIQEVIQSLTEYEPIWNEFHSAIINKIGQTIIRNKLWQNELHKWKSGLLTAGDTVEEIMVGLLKARTYNYDREALEKDIFGTYKPEVQASYHRINRQEYYAITVNDELLKRAFLTPNGLATYISGLMTAPTNSDSLDEFLQMTGLLGEWYRAGGFYRVHVDDISAIGSTEAQAKYFLRRVREFAGNLKVPNTRYNAARMPSFANPDELELIVTPEALAAIDVEALAGAFNIDRAEIKMRITVIPSEHWHIPGAQAILTTKDFFVIMDTLIRTASQPNPVTLSTNYFYHHHQILSLSRFAPAILFWTGEGTDDTVIETPVTGVSTITVRDEDGNVVTSVERGGMYGIVGEAITAGDNDALRLELTGNSTRKTRLPNQTAVLYVDETEEADTLVINGYAVDTDIPQLVGTVSVTVTGERLQLWPDTQVERDDDNDGIEEVTPEELTKSDDDIVTIPYVKGIQYKKTGTNVAAGSTHTITTSTTFTAEARTGKELTPGATASWTFVP